MYKQNIYDEVERLSEVGLNACRFIWNNPEVGGTESVSSDFYRDLLAKEGFKIVNDEKLPYAFYAEYGEGKPVIALLGEYDALPALSQEASAERKAVEEGKPGHGCGHNLLGSGAYLAALAIKTFIEKGELKGTIRYYGCPEEELLSGKVKMIYHGMFEGCDFAMSWHPMPSNEVYDEAFLASASMKFHFKGKTSHAGFAPEQGRSALDAVELMNVGCNYLREHIVDKCRIHYTTDSYGYPPNIVPDKASSWYCIRAPRIDIVKDIMRRLELVARGAAMMTETEVDIEVISGCCELNPNHAFSDLTYQNMVQVNLPQYTEEEMAFAKALQATLNPAILAKDEKTFNSYGTGMHLDLCSREKYKETPLNASSDSGDVSMIMPMNYFTTACFPLGVAAHTWQATASAGSSIGEKGMLYAAKITAGVIYDLLTDEEARDRITKEFNENKPEYSPMYQE
ncbi:MAG: amidohydrolase [Mogibacterium sp.]|nr:amidohydrolase [Mogibacterium sp.]